MEKLLTIQEISDILGIKDCTIRAWVFQRKIPCVRIGRLVRFRMSEIETWINQKH